MEACSPTMRHHTSSSKCDGCVLDGHIECVLSGEIILVWLAVGVVVAIEVEPESTMRYDRELMTEFDRC